jgi:hypothetical protein
MPGERRRQAHHGYDQGGAAFCTRFTSIRAKTLRTYHRHSAPATHAGGHPRWRPLLEGNAKYRCLIKAEMGNWPATRPTPRVN